MQPYETVSILSTVAKQKHAPTKGACFCFMQRGTPHLPQSPVTTARRKISKRQVRLNLSLCMYQLFDKLEFGELLSANHF